MDNEPFYQEVLRKYALPICLAGLAVVFLIFGLVAILGNSNSSDYVVFKEAEEKKPQKITVDVEGAVVSPGVYSLNSDARIKDAIVAAGGLSYMADRLWVAKNINLASVAQDSSKIYIPEKGEPSSSGSSGTSSAANLININTASSKELDTLPGIGPVTAEKIINGRPYSSIDDLLKKKVISQKVFDGLKEKITAY